jgi:hypothetical protein
MGTEENVSLASAHPRDRFQPLPLGLAFAGAGCVLLRSKLSRDGLRPINWRSIWGRYDLTSRKHYVRDHFGLDDLRQFQFPQGRDKTSRRDGEEVEPWPR